MDKPNKNIVSGKLEKYEKLEVKVDSESIPTYTKVAKTVKLRSCYDARLQYKGQVTGKLYSWNKAGSVVEVDSLDSEYLLAKRLGAKPCCGNSRGGNPIFEISN